MFNLRRLLNHGLVHAFGVLREDRQIECLAQVVGPHRTAGVGEDLLVGRVVRHVEAGRLLDGLRSEDGEEGLAGDAQVLALRVEFAEARGEFLDGRAELSGLLAQFALPGVDVGEDRP
ncbi:hypothetical protein [Streptomyces sp. NPDC050485]|uniref:hypothetical protein n=1 Tax=Streptomyces sp. NPDC050485 TaxID=3365617 RepID=UPI0037BB0E0C